MQIARIRRTRGARVEIAAWRPERGLLPLEIALGEIGHDTVALVTRSDWPDLAAKIDAAWRSCSPGDLVALDEVVVEPPVARCGKICCLALNYRAHAEESGLEVPPVPVLFFKPATALIGHGAVVTAPSRTRHVEHEVELAVVIGRACRDVPADDWEQVVAGYTIINDLTARDLQLVNHERNVPWDQSKAFDGFAPCGPFLTTLDEIPDPSALEMTLTIDGEVRQHALTSQMVFGIPQLIEDLSNGMTLEPGDLIATGTTAGIAPVADGDEMRANISGLGTLANMLRFEA